MKHKTMCKELFFLRAIACLSIVFLHSIEIGKSYIHGAVALLFDSFQVLLYYATPLFIFISMFILAFSYRQKPLPTTFLRKRFLYIFLPFLFMAFFYSIPYASSFENWGIKLFLNAVIGDYHGYFVLIIFQFFMLYLFTHRILSNLNPSVILTFSFIVNVLYLLFFTFTTPWPIPYADYIWERFYWVPFPGWLFYFVLGFYCGHYYESFVSHLKRWKALVFIAPITSSVLLLYLYHAEWLTIHSSKRPDILLHTIAVGFFLFYIAHRLQSLPRMIVWISQYSFGIYLLHMFYLSVFDFLYQHSSYQLGSAYIFLLFSGSTLCSMATVHYVTKWKYGAYFIGKVGAAYQEDIQVKKKPKRRLRALSSSTS